MIKVVENEELDNLNRTLNVSALNVGMIFGMMMTVWRKNDEIYFNQ